MVIEVKILKVDKELPTPHYKYDGDAGMDLYSAEDYNLGQGEIRLFRTGLRIAVPYGYEMQIRPRSGLAANYGISIINTPCTIDACYRGDINIALINLGKEAYNVKRGERIAQAVFKKVERAELVEVEELDETKRGKEGFGSTGRF